MNESQLINELCSALDEEAAAVRAPAAAAARARASACRRRATRRLGAGLSAAGLAACLVIVAVSGSHAPVPSTGGAAGAHQPPAQSVAYVTGRARVALNEVSDWIVKTDGNGWVGWWDSVTGANRLEEFGPGGRLASDETVSYTGLTEHQVSVDYARHTWWELVYKVPAVPKKRNPSGVLPAPGDSASGQVKILGHRNLRGRDTILVWYGPPRDFRPTASVSWATEQVWLDASTYLPVRIEIFGVGGEDESLAYLPATPANLATLTTLPPTGFKQVTPPPQH